MTEQGSPTDYIHGFGPVEEQRLRDQARVLAAPVFGGMRLPTHGRLLELGCGVGAELDLISALRPELDLIGVDLSGSHIKSAHDHVPKASLVQADAMLLPFPDEAFDCVITVWMLEHVATPLQVLAEAVRVLRPGGRLICTEVDNDTFRFSPEQPAISSWWDMFCRRQQEAGGDPYVGRRLKGFADLMSLVEVSAVDIAVVASSEPDQRATLISYVRDLLLSGAGSLIEHGLAEGRTTVDLQRAFAAVAADDTIQFEYHAVRMTAVKPE